MTKRIVLTLPLLLALEGCVQTLAIRTMAGIMDYGFEAFNEESDLQMAREALSGNLKLVEALIKGDPDNEKLLLFASQGYNAYALAFAEDDSVERARVFYLRGRDFALRVLSRNTAFKNSIDKEDSAFREAVKTLGKADVPAAFWAAFGWGSYVNLTRTQTAALADLAQISVLMQFVLDNDPGYYFGGADLFFGVIEGSTPAVLGGKPDKSKAHFEKSLSITGGKFLMTYVYYAKTYAVQVQDQQLFESLLKKVDEASIDILPEARLANAVAKRKAKLLKEKENELF